MGEFTPNQVALIFYMQIPCDLSYDKDPVKWQSLYSNNCVRDQIYDAGFVCDMVIDQGNTFNKDIRNAQLAQYNFILVVGEKEATNKTANVRTRDNKVHGEFSIDDIVQKFVKFDTTKAADAEENFD
ncbi:hypothetical protein FSP39_009203 [Pinctada imbricata]|uniref:Anticodon-binding domain-containing protein n=1 Tax=Pinctada imbricata TaxID=66713 RepID=A0AA88YBH9_PINIB|nr:hypothetical protein FSP39_001910 [Pinctada imbricata]KAK3097389.1 hypothetical protein FSP39_009203 [Pinctada imbricata]